jgi:hypothetical protein
MKKLHLILIAIVAIIVIFLASTIASPILIVAEDSGEDGSIDMAASFSLGGFKWIYPGSSFNAEGQTLHNVHINDPQDPYGAARDIMEYTYNFRPFLVVSINNDAAAAIFGGDIVDDIRANDAYNGYAGNDNVPGTMDRGDAVGTAMSENGMNVFQIPIQILLGNISFHFV